MTRGSTGRCSRRNSRAMPRAPRLRRSGMSPPGRRPLRRRRGQLPSWSPSRSPGPNWQRRLSDQSQRLWSLLSPSPNQLRNHLLNQSQQLLLLLLLLLLNPNQYQSQSLCQRQLPLLTLLLLLLLQNQLLNQMLPSRN